MKKIKLLLVSIHIKDSPQGIPLAAAMLKAQLDSFPEINAKLDTSFIDFYAGTSAEDVAWSILSQSPDMAGLSIYLWNRDLSEEICRIVKERNPQILLFAGGAEATAAPCSLLLSAPFDFIISGEGEHALTEMIKRILKNKSYDDINGVLIRDRTSNAENSQWPVKDLDLLVSPFLSGVLDVEKYSGVLWELSRGCPFRCSFCFESKGVSGVRQFSLERIKSELELFEAKKVKQVFVLDPTFNRDKKRAKKILRMIAQIAPLIHFTFEARTEFIDREMASLFADINCSLQIGLQSAHPDVLAGLNRSIDPDRYAEQISLLNECGVIFGLDLIYGLPGDTAGGFRQSLNYALNLQPNHIDIFPLAVLPGTVLHDKAQSLKLDFLPEAPYTLVSAPGFSEADMKIAELLKRGCDIFYNLGGAAGWMFMVTETLGIEPVELMEHFIKDNSIEFFESEISKDQITGVQISFVKQMFSKFKKTDLFSVIEDIILFHGALNRSLYAGPFTGEIIPFNENSLFRLSPGTEVLELKYNFDDLMTVGEFNLEEFLYQYEQEQSFVAIYNCGGEVKPLIINEHLCKILKAFASEISLSGFLQINPCCDREEIFEFVEYALAETMIHSI